MRNDRAWRLGHPKAPGGTSPICDVEVKNFYGFLRHIPAQWHGIDRCWKRYPGGEEIETKVLAYDIIDARYYGTQEKDQPVFEE